MTTKLAELANASPAELQAGDWKIVAATLERAQKELEAARGGRQTWLDGAVGIAKERALAQELQEQLPAQFPQVVVCMEGGLITSVLSAEPVALAIIDYDTECAEAADLCDIPQGNGKFAEGYAWVRSADVNPARTAELVAAVITPSPVIREEELEAPAP